MSNTPAKYEVLIKQYLRSILDISAFKSKVTLLPRTELRPVSFNKRQRNEKAFFFFRNIHDARMFPQCPQFLIRETLLPVSVFVFKMQIILTLHCGEF